MLLNHYLKMGKELMKTCNNLLLDIKDYSYKLLIGILTNAKITFIFWVCKAII